MKLAAKIGSIVFFFFMLLGLFTALADDSRLTADTILGFIVVTAPVLPMAIYAWLAEKKKVETKQILND
jgi:uncharacterized RDD family membrane protein YckC